MSYTLRQAATAVARSKPTVLRAIQSGKISAAKDALGEWRIEAAELHRVYPPVTVQRNGPNGTRNAAQHSDSPTETALLRAEAENLRKLVAALEADRDTAAETVADLRRRLDRAEDERREAQRQVAALLTHQQARTARAVPTGSVPNVGHERRGWWWRWLR